MNYISERPRSIFKKVKKFLNKVGLQKFRLWFLERTRLGIFNSQVGKAIIDYYDGYWGQQVDRSTGNLGFGFFHYGLITSVKPKRILCIGSQRGFIPLICAFACRDNGRGFVDFVDAGYDEGHPKAWSGEGFWRKVDPDAHFSRLVGKGFIKTYIMTTIEFAGKFPKRRYDYIYIDGDHAYKGVKKDYNLFWKRLNPSGFMSFHDITAKGKFRNRYEFGVWRLWKEIAKDRNAIFFQAHPGLGVIQKIIK